MLWLLAILMGILPAVGLAQAGVVKGERLKSSQLASLPDSAFYPGYIAVKLKSDYTGLNAQASIVNGLVTFNAAAIDRLMARFSIKNYKALFNTAFTDAADRENLEAITAMQQWGFQQWFHFQFDERISVREVAAAFMESGVAEVAEPVFRIMPTWVPNDTRFADQWAFNNTGQAGGSSGADIQLTRAWNIEKGKPNVLVAVHDGGINYLHPDLAQNMWPGIGYNFLTDNNQLVFDQHATHVSGILAAVSNNNLGVSGIAGGDGSVGSGARLMSLQIIGSANGTPGYEAVSFLFAANNGACISQNSWSYNSPNVFPQATADAIDYFISQGGGQVTRGGLAVFSAGNDNSERQFFPSAYSRVLCVAATNNRDQRSPYSSYGSFVDICAPGGDMTTNGGSYAGGILSTVLGSGYDFMQGTSMACPQVSGVAALIASHIPGRLLASDVRAILLASTDNIGNINPGFTNKLGSGRLNAFRALSMADDIARQPVIIPVTNVNITPICDRVKLSWLPPAGSAGIMVVYGEGGEMGLPNGSSFLPGQNLPGGGVVVYKGNENSAEFPMAMDGRTMVFRVYVVNEAARNYSMAAEARYTVPFTVQNPVASSTANSISLSWTRVCPKRNTLLVINTEEAFGFPSGNPAAITNLPNGGTALAYGNLSSHTEGRLLADQVYYFAFFSYDIVGGVYVYGSPLVIKASTACPEAAFNVVESFTAIDFPPPGWLVFDGGPNGSANSDGRSWQRYVGAGSRTGDQASALVRAFVDNGNNSREVLRSSRLLITPDIDSVFVDFDYAYRAYGPNAQMADSLEFGISGDCGITFTSVWKAGGETLSTVPGFQTTEFIPASPAQWAHQSFNLTTLAKQSGAVNFLWRANNKFGQNIFLDNISLRKVSLPQYDVTPLKVLEPSEGLLCDGRIAPLITIKNQGKTSLGTLQLNWRFNGGSIQKAVYTGLAVPMSKDTVLRLPLQALTAGGYRLQLWTSMPNGQPDEQPANDTIKAEFTVFGSQNTPLSENFESPSFPPAGWGILNPDGKITWSRAKTVGWAGLGAAWLNNFDYASNNAADWLISPVLQADAAYDSLLLEFSVAAASRGANGSLGAGFDTLEVLITTDCGKTVYPVYVKGGTGLQTVTGLNTTAFLPGTGEWRREHISLEPLRNKLLNGFQVAFKNRTQNGNDLFIDDVVVYGKTLPNGLKQNGFELYPNPSKGIINLHHLKPALTLSTVTIINAMGQVNWQKRYEAGSAPQLLPISVAGFQDGLYMMRLQYADRVIIRRFLKLSR